MGESIATTFVGVYSGAHESGSGVANHPTWSLMSRGRRPDTPHVLVDTERRESLLGPQGIANRMADPRFSGHPRRRLLLFVVSTAARRLAPSLVAERNFDYETELSGHMYLQRTT